MKISYIEIEQPIGTFYICCIPAETLLKIVNVIPRTNTNNGVQRELSKQRINEIADYCSDPDAIFPTPIVISVENNKSIVLDESNHTMEINEETGILGEVLDGQHRLWGIEKSSFVSSFNLPVVMMFDLTVEEKAYIFSTINSNQTKVNPSLIYDLFDVSSLRSPYNTVHRIARVMNYTQSSPFYNRLKMLGKKEPSQDKATLSQGTFAKSLLKLISNKPDKDTRFIKLGQILEPDKNLCFRDYFIEEKDEVITKILFNCFNALRTVFHDEWITPNNNILWKTTGFCAILYSMPYLYKKGQAQQNLQQDFFESCFKQFKNKLLQENISLTSKNFPGGGDQNQKKLSNLIIESLS